MKRFSRLIDRPLRMLEAERLVRASGYFDAEWYARTNPQVGGAQKALAHFMRTGAAEGRDPGPKFSTSAYLAANPDVRAAGYNALVHYLRFGRDEGRGTQNTATGEAECLGPAAMDRIAEAFDATFYAATNPDLPEDEATCGHFLSTGWHDRRDPCDWFSVEAYLSEHDDVAETGQNPFVHYLLWGCREGRMIRSSQRRKHERAKRHKNRPRLAALAMVRNEGDILRAFSGHLLALFDDIVFVDHMSVDGSGEYLDALARGNRRIEVLRLEEPAYIQSVAMTHVVRDRPALREADWVFLLDADEFLPFSDRAEFDTALEGLASCPVVEMRWQNLVPQTYFEGEVDLSPEVRFIAPPEVSPFRKIAFQPARISLERTVVAQGNHALIETWNGLHVPAFAAGFPLIHLPVRSVDQLVLKLNQGVEAYRRLGLTRDAAHGTHWDQMLRATSDRDLTPDVLNAVVVDYSEDKPELTPVSIGALLDSGHREVTYDLAMAEVGEGPSGRRSLGEVLMRIHAMPAPDRPVEDCPGTTKLKTLGTRLIRSEGDAGVRYPRLARVETDAPLPSLPEALACILAPGFRDIEDLLPSAKARHIPFLLALADVVRPRRVVEIGTLRGAGFFALCQAIQRSELTCEAIAISGWSVEPELQAEYANAFETFSFLARKYSDFAGYLRQRHEDAAVHFEDGSIDILMLDGFCEEEALERAIALWRPKLSSRGVLVLHDTNAHGGDFGVWRVWDDLSSVVPSLSFPHAEGLGMACIGPEAPAELRVLSSAFETDRHVRHLINHHFERLGSISTELFSRRYDMAQAEARVRAEGAQSEELSWLRQDCEALRTENEQLRTLLKGGLAHAVTV